MASAKLKRLNNLNWDCTICGEVLVEPTNFSGCGHVFCMECLEQWKFKEAGQIKCPNCREPSHSCQTNAKQPNLLLSQVLDTIMPQSYQERKEEYYNLKEKHEIIRKFLMSDHVCKSFEKLGEYMKNSDQAAVTVSQLAEVLKTSFENVKKPMMEIKLYLSTFLGEFVFIHNNNIIRRNTIDMEQYIQDHADEMSGPEMAAFIQPTTTLNYDVICSSTGLSSQLRDYVEKNLDKIVKYIKKNYKQLDHDHSIFPDRDDLANAFMGE